MCAPEHAMVLNKQISSSNCVIVASVDMRLIENINEQGLLVDIELTQPNTEFWSPLRRFTVSRALCPSNLGMRLIEGDKSDK